MEAIQVETSNFIYRAPLGKEEEIGDLHCERKDGVVWSVWKLSDEERTAILEGANIKLGIWTEPIPPVLVKVTTDKEVGSVS